MIQPKLIFNICTSSHTLRITGFLLPNDCFYERISYSALSGLSEYYSLLSGNCVSNLKLTIFHLMFMKYDLIITDMETTRDENESN